MVAQPTSSPLWFEVLGPVRGRREGGDLDLGSGKQRAVLAVLLLHRNTAVTTSRIVEAVWGDEPPLNGTNVVQKYVAGLRRSLEPAREARAPGHLLALDEAGYTLAVGPDQLDLDTFERLRRSGLRHRDEGRAEQALRTLRDAADLVTAEPLAGLPGEWFAAARARIVEEWTDTLEACVELEVALGRHERALPEIRGLVARFPLRERLRGALMLALYRSGRPAEALAAFQETREHLVETLGVEPGPALQDLHGRMLRSDPSLVADGPATADAVPGPRLTLVRPEGPADVRRPTGPAAPPHDRPPVQPASAAAVHELLPPYGQVPYLPYAVPGGAPRPAPPKPGAGAWILLAGTAAAALLSFGFASPILLLVLAGATWSRARRIFLVAVVLFVTWCVAFMLAATTNEESVLALLGVLGLIAVAFGTIAATAYQLFGPFSRTP